MGDAKIKSALALRRLPAPSQKGLLQILQFTQAREAEDLQEPPRRHIGVRRPGFGRAKGAINLPMPLERCPLYSR